MKCRLCCSLLSTRWLITFFIFLLWRFSGGVSEAGSSFQLKRVCVFIRALLWPQGAPYVYPCLHWVHNPSTLLSISINLTLALNVLAARSGMLAKLNKSTKFIFLQIHCSITYSELSSLNSSVCCSAMRVRWWNWVFWTKPWGEECCMWKENCPKILFWQISLASSRSRSPGLRSRDLSNHSNPVVLCEAPDKPIDIRKEQAKSR